MRDTQATFMVLNPQEREILLECDELTLDFTSFNKDSVSMIPPQCVVIGYGDLCDEFLAMCVEKDHAYTLEISQLLPQDFVSLKGRLGAFELRFKDSHGGVDILRSAQVVCFAPIDLPQCKGVHKPDMYQSADEMLQALLALCGRQSYERNIVFNPIHCQFQLRRPLQNGQSVCHSCADICPTLGIASDKDLRILELSAVDCIACGKCVSVCPTGSVWREGDGLEAFTYKARLYKGYVPLVVAGEEFYKQTFARELEILKKCNPLILPFVLQVPDMLNSAYFLTLLQESGSPILLYRALGEHTDEDVDSINEIYKRIFSQQAIYSLQALHEEDISALQPLPHTHYTYTPSENENNRDVFSERLRFWVRQEDYGRVAIKGFGALGISAKQCTLCMSCVEACNTGALLHHQSRFELLYKPALCTDCGYCVSSCAEQILSLESRTLPLAPQSFEYTSIASDEPFRCVECQKIFATKKSIDKIKGILSPAFGGDTLKLKSLECCADCKVKIMFEGERA